MSSSALNASSTFVWGVTGSFFGRGVTLAARCCSESRVLSAERSTAFLTVEGMMRTGCIAGFESLAIEKWTIV